jgi:hypothetical protein
MPRFVSSIAVGAGLCLVAVACSSDGSSGDTTPVQSTSADNASGAYLQECMDKKAAGQAVLDATNVGSKALRGDDVEEARAAYVAYYDAYEHDVQTIVALAHRIKDDPDAPDRVIEAADESLAAGEAFETTVSTARDELAQADSIEAIGETFLNFQDGLRGSVPGGGPQLLPPALFSWMNGDGADCGAS